MMAPPHDTQPGRDTWIQGRAGGLGYMDTELEGCHHDALVTNFPRVWCGVCGPGGVEATSRHRVFNKLGHIEILNVLCTFKAIRDM